VVPVVGDWVGAVMTARPPIAGEGCLLVLALATLLMAVGCLALVGVMAIRHRTDPAPVIVIAQPPKAHR
jgi:hypothetical protein